MPKRLILIFAVLLLGACTEPDRPSIPLSLAVERGDIDQLERHLFWGSDVEAMNPDGERPLHVATAKGNVVMVRKLIAHGAQVDALDASGRSALQIAMHAGRTQVADVLLAGGATLDANKLLIEAATQGNPDRDVVRYLIRHGADLEARDEHGDTALLIAIRNGHLRIARHLVDSGANVNVRDGAGQSALSLTLQLHEQEMAALLRRYGAIDGIKSPQDGQ